MQKSRLIDLLINVVVPGIAGGVIYLVPSVHGILRNYLPDGLWAYSFLSSILIIWERKLPFSWIAIVYVFFGVFEYLQGFGWLPGTGDSNDVFTYSAFSCFALLANRYFYKTFNYANDFQNKTA